jgi:phosphate transport system protein
MPNRPVFDRYLVAVIDDLLRLSSMAEQAIATSMMALVERNAALATQVSSNDVMLNEIRYAIEETCYQLIATQAPNSTDLRTIVGAVSVATNLERIGDHAAGIARLTLRMIDQPPLKPLVDLPQMAEIAREMVRNSVLAFSNRNVTLSESVVKRDDAIDLLHQKVYTDLVAYMTKDVNNIERATLLLWVSHNLERIGDRACNICERAIYVATGELKEIS